jgi:hypothetical protein
MARLSYFEKLRDPRWQRKRLEILGAQGFTCQRCSDGSSPLHVHHAFYAKGLEPWEYEAGAYVVLCESCHETAEVERRAVVRLSGLMMAKGMGAELLAFMAARMALLEHEPTRIAVTGGADADGIAMALGESAQSIWERAQANGGFVDPVAIEEEQYPQ